MKERLNIKLIENNNEFVLTKFCANYVVFEFFKEGEICQNVRFLADNLIFNN